MLERPGTQFRIYRSATVGDNQAGGIGAMTLPGTRIRGVIVDNPSGSWVKLDGVGLGFQPYVAPYTLAWSVSLLPSVTELSAAYVDGPTGQSSSNAGAPLVVYLFEAQVPSSPGSAFVTPAPETLSTYNAWWATPTAAAYILVPGVPNQRIRLYALTAVPSILPATGCLDTPWEVYFRGASDQAQVRRAMINGEPGSGGTVDAAGNTLADGDDLQVVVQTRWSSLVLRIAATYQVV
jgi:hypothetical protein